MTIKYSYHQPEQLNRLYGTTEQNAKRHDNMPFGELPDSNKAKESTISASGEAPILPTYDKASKVLLTRLNPESIIQGVIFSEIIGKPRCFRRRIR